MLRDNVTSNKFARDTDRSEREYVVQIKVVQSSQLVSEMDLRAVEEEYKFASAREAVLPTLDLQHTR